MKGMFLAILAAVMLMVFSFSAMAQTSWTGPYIGLNAGYGAGKWDAFNFERLEQEDVTRLNPKNNKGILGGVEAGYNWMLGNMVFGIVGDFSLSDIDGLRTYPVDLDEGGTYLSSTKSTLNRLGTLRGRLGYVLGDRILVYGTAGVARAQAKIVLDWGYPSPDPYSWGRTANGWVLGYGVEYAVTSRWSGKVEYIRLQMKEADYDVVDPFNVIKVGINYHL